MFPNIVLVTNLETLSGNSRILGYVMIHFIIHTCKPHIQTSSVRLIQCIPSNPSSVLSTLILSFKLRLYPKNELSYKPCVTFRNKSVSYGGDLLAPRPTLKSDDKLSVRDWSLYASSCLVCGLRCWKSENKRSLRKVGVYWGIILKRVLINGMVRLGLDKSNSGQKKKNASFYERNIKFRIS
jgi:hypothetical protein